MLHGKDPSDVRYLLGLVTIVGVPLCQKVECSYYVMDIPGITSVEIVQIFSLLLIV